VSASHTEQFATAGLRSHCWYGETPATYMKVKAEGVKKPAAHFLHSLPSW